MRIHRRTFLKSGLGAIAALVPVPSLAQAERFELPDPSVSVAYVDTSEELGIMLAIYRFATEHDARMGYWELGKGKLAQVTGASVAISEDIRPDKLEEVDADEGRNFLISVGEERWPGIAVVTRHRTELRLSIVWGSGVEAAYDEMGDVIGGFHSSGVPPREVDGFTQVS